jgi:hypothetical protein
VWQGLGHVINSFRKNMLGLEVLTSSQGAGVLDMLKIPWTYCWSDSLLPKPKDWKEHIGVCLQPSAQRQLTNRYLGLLLFRRCYILHSTRRSRSFPQVWQSADIHRVCVPISKNRLALTSRFGSVPVEDPEIVTGSSFNFVPIGMR